MIASRLEPSRVRPLDLLRLGVLGLRSRRLRASLTAVAIAIGIAAMVAVLGISESSRAGLLSQLDQLGTNLLTVQAGKTLFGDSAALPMTAEAMIGRIGPVESTGATAHIDATVRRTDLVPSAQTGGIEVIATSPNLLETIRGSMADGTFLNAATARYPAVVLGSLSARRLGISRVEPTSRVYISGEWFTVVGILEPVGLAPELDTAALIGFSIAAELFDHDGAAGTIYLRAHSDHVTDVRRVVGATANPEHPEEVQVSRPSDALEARAAAAVAFSSLFLALAAVALVVAGIGIANVMLMSVLERRSEIGLRRALGATGRHIATQFLTEALALGLLGGAAGVAIGGAVAAGYARTQGWQVVIPPAAVAGGLVAALFVGAVAGLYPAVRAARISPTQALRSM